MPLRLEAAADHEDWPDDELAQLRGQHCAARQSLSEVLALLGKLPAGHWMRPHHSRAAVTYSRVISYTTGRLRELGHPLPSERIAA
jgi:hypothetical protein